MATERHYADGGPCPKCGREMGHASGLGMCDICRWLETPMPTKGRCATCRHVADDGRDVWCGKGVSEQGRTSGLVSSGFGCVQHEAKEGV